MTGHGSQLLISLSRPDGGDLAQLARRTATTRQVLALVAVRQLLAAHRGGATPAATPSGEAEGALDGVGVTVTLNDAERDALDGLAGRLGTTPAAIGRQAIQTMLAAFKAGAVPLVKPMTPLPFVEVEPSSALAAKANLLKAKLIVDRLHQISESGFDEANRAALGELEALRTIPPY